MSITKVPPAIAVWLLVSGFGQTALAQQKISATCPATYGLLVAGKIANFGGFPNVAIMMEPTHTRTSPGFGNASYSSPQSLPISHPAYTNKEVRFYTLSYGAICFKLGSAPFVYVESTGYVNYYQVALWKIGGGCETTLWDPSLVENCGEPTAGGSGGGSNCTLLYITIEVWNSTTGTWDVYWQGYGNVCG